MNVEKITLNNSVKALNIHIPDSLSSTIMFFAKAGSRYETTAENGIAHFMEHTLLNGSPNYKTPADVAKAIELLGGYSNAYTNKEYVVYFIKCPNENFSKAFDILADLFLNPTFEKADIEKEKGIILEEYKKREDNPGILCYEYFLSDLFKGDKLGQRILGTEENIKKFTREEILEYKNKYYTANNILISVAGDLDSKVVEEKIKLFETLPKSDKDYFEKSTGTFEEEKNIVEKDVKQTQLVYGTYGLPAEHKDLPALRVAMFALGRGSGSALNQRIREELGLAYGIYTYWHSFEERGMVCIQTGIDKKNIDLCITEIDKILERFMNEELTDEEILRAKQVYKSGFLDFNNSYEMADFLGEDELLYGQYKLPQEYINEVECVTADQVKRVMKELWSQKRHLNIITNKD